MRIFGHESESPGSVLNTAGTNTRAGVAWDIWSTPRAIGDGRETSGTAGQHRVTTVTSLSQPGELVDPAGPRTCSRVLRESWLTPRAFGPKRELPRRAGQIRRLSEPCASLRGDLVDPAGPRKRAREDWDSWSTLWTIGPGPESHGTDGRTCGTLDMSPSRPGVYSTPLVTVPEPE